MIKDFVLFKCDLLLTFYNTGHCFFIGSVYLCPLTGNYRTVNIHGIINFVVWLNVFFCRTNQWWPLDWCLLPCVCATWATCMHRKKTISRCMRPSTVRESDTQGGRLPNGTDDRHAAELCVCVCVCGLNNIYLNASVHSSEVQLVPPAYETQTDVNEIRMCFISGTLKLLDCWTNKTVENVTSDEQPLH